ncbi:MAG: enoyl-CoA hydratase-related protein [Aggregatilineales bacterium]
MFETVDFRLEPPFAYITLNRPEVKNALSRQLTRELLEAFKTLQDNKDIRAILLSGAGGTFCAGGDLKEMREAFNDSTESSDLDFEALLIAINEAPQVVVAKIEGAAMGGGFGMVCVSDIAIASDTALMGLPEVKLGIAPAFISPYVIQRIGLTRSRELMLTGRRFDGATAHAYGLVHEVVPQDNIDARITQILNDLRDCSPNAVRAIKSLIFAVKDKSFDETVTYRANLLQSLRAGDDAQEGIAAFMGRRKPAWATADDKGDGE